MGVVVISIVATDAQVLKKHKAISVDSAWSQ